MPCNQVPLKLPVMVDCPGISSQNNPFLLSIAFVSVFNSIITVILMCVFACTCHDVLVEEDNFAESGLSTSTFKRVPGLNSGDQAFVIGQQVLFPMGPPHWLLEPHPHSL